MMGFCADRPDNVDVSEGFMVYFFSVSFEFTFCIFFYEFMDDSFAIPGKERGQQLSEQSMSQP